MGFSSLPGGLLNWTLRAFKLIRITVRHWQEDHCSLIAAGLAYYTIISLIPLFILALAISGKILGPAASMNQLAPVLEGMMGEQIARPLEMLVVQASQKQLRGATVASLAILLWVASIMFSNLQRALNMVWECSPKQGVGGALVTRLTSFGMVMGVGFLVVFFASLNAGLGLVRSFLDPWAPFLEQFPFWWAMNLGLFLAALMLFWGMVYKFLPALKLRWRDVWVGSFVTSILVTVGVYGVGFYFSVIKFWSIFGAATSLMLVLIWIYFTAQIFLLGAEFTWAWAHRKELLDGSVVPPRPGDRGSTGHPRG
ncbi:MAG: YihY/virulence factor BrkB family protein [Elusimicrobia bacterium]|jgi:membrane protein|nr:YihY/virulence factor BrkB family protein [Elusimicrobiota bacterium]